MATVKAMRLAGHGMTCAKWRAPKIEPQLWVAHVWYSHAIIEVRRPIVRVVAATDEKGCKFGGELGVHS